LSGHYLQFMDLEAFYRQDERRRSSEEIEYGRDWQDGHGNRYEISYVVDTGELYAMRDPIGGLVPVTWFGELFSTPVPEGSLAVAVLATVDEPDALADALEGWPEAMAGADGIAWLVERMHRTGIRPNEETSL
jgi:hypothetical protein